MICFDGTPNGHAAIVTAEQTFRTRRLQAAASP